MSTSGSSSNSVFHEGEIEVQAHVGVRKELAYWGQKAIRPILIEQHQTFFCQLPFMVLSARDHNGLPWVTLLTQNTAGPAPTSSNDVTSEGFITSPDNTHLHFAANPIKGDALEHAFVEGTDIGLVGIELHSRRRNRVNGVLSKVKENSITFEVTQAFGNCPQYICERILRAVNVDQTKTQVSRHKRLTDSMKEWIHAADTLFIASGYEQKLPGNAQEKSAEVYNGMDASHRGGAPGFVKITNDDKLVLPDYAGNNFFNTIGNLVIDPRVGLLFIDFETGSLLQISGRVTIDWDSAAVKKHVGAHRLLNIEIDEIVQLNHVLPLRWSFKTVIENGLQVIKKTKESEDVTSFELAPATFKTKLPAFRAGQHLPIQLEVGEDKQRIERTYSLSNSPNDVHYRISVKREPLGIASQHLHDHIQVGDVINAKQPSGDFLAKFPTRPVVLISAGVGITPIASMLHSLTAMSIPSAVNVFCSVRDSQHAPLLQEIRELNQQDEKVSLGIAFSQPNESDKLGVDYDIEGRLHADFLKQGISDLHSDFYICGPTGFLTTIIEALDEIGVKKERINFESF